MEQTTPEETLAGVQGMRIPPDLARHIMDSAVRTGLAGIRERHSGRWPLIGRDNENRHWVASRCDGAGMWTHVVQPTLTELDRDLSARRDGTGP